MWVPQRAVNTASIFDWLHVPAAIEKGLGMAVAGKTFPQAQSWTNEMRTQKYEPEHAKSKNMDSGQ